MNAALDITKPAVRLNEFSLSYPKANGDSALKALDKIDLTVAPGEFLAIVGPSGCGKTTLLRSIAGLLTDRNDSAACSGDLHVFGLAPPEAKRQRAFAFTFQNPILLPWRNVRENVALPLEIANALAPINKRTVDEMLSMVGIADFATAFPHEISGGMQQRVNLARALVQDPAILLMDEPFGNLDEVTRERLNFELLRIHRLKNQTVFFVTHSLSEASLLADRIVILSERPGSVHTTIPVDLPRDRTDALLTSPNYLNLVRRVRDAFAQSEVHK